MIEHVLGLLQKYHSRGVLVDTNILLLFFIGSLNRALISRFKRTKAYSADDYDVLCRILSQFDRKVTTPSILTEVSNLSSQLREPARTSFFQEFAKGITTLSEQYVVSANAARQSCFPRLGLTDAGIMQLAKGNYLVITDDFALYGFLDKMGIDVLSFSHLRPIF